MCQARRLGSLDKDRTGPAIVPLAFLLITEGAFTSVFKDKIVIYEVTKLYKLSFIFWLANRRTGTVILTFENRAERVGICVDNGLDNEDPDPHPER